jgi:hypothetical protein
MRDFPRPSISEFFNNICAHLPYDVDSGMAETEAKRKLLAHLYVL